MSVRIIFIWLLSAAATLDVAAQRKPRHAPPAPVPASTFQAEAPVLRQNLPDGLVYVHQTIDLKRNEEEIPRLDGEPLKPLLTKNITLGVVIDAEGHIVTRLVGVTPSAPPFKLTILPLKESPRPLEASFIGMDSVTGLCVLKITGAALKPAVLTSRAVLPLRLEVRMWGFHPLQGQRSQTMPVSLNRPRINPVPAQVAKAVKDFRYNSGNPLYELLTPQLAPVQDGSLIVENDNTVFGIAVYDTSGENGNLVYPISRVQNLVAQVIKSNESIAFGWLGATGDDRPAAINSPITPELGVIIQNVFPDSPADLAGIRKKDLLLRINDRRIENRAQLATALRQLPPDSEIRIGIKRGEQYKVLNAKLVPAPAIEANQQYYALGRRMEAIEKQLQQLPPNDPQRRDLAPKASVYRSVMDSITQVAPPEVRLRVLYGLEVQSLTAQLSSYFAVPHGVLVSTVGETSKLAQAGLRAGDVLLQIGEREITDAAALKQALDGGASSALEITVSRRREQVKFSLIR